jgi:hypothetical protein
MGMVYEGFDPVIERKVAIKTILADYLEAAEIEDAVARFKREAQAAGACSIPASSPCSSTATTATWPSSSWSTPRATS